MDKDLKNFRNGRSDILVATPGRLLDHIENYGLGARLAGVRYVVLDEADR
jgi:ATP-dependent RNA helicase MSS116, mitochondrial